MHGRMAPLATNPCTDGETICNQIFDWTDNATFARYSDIVIGKPLVLLGLLPPGASPSAGCCSDS